MAYSLVGRLVVLSLNKEGILSFPRSCPTKTWGRGKEDISTT